MPDDDLVLPAVEWEPLSLGGMWKFDVPVDALPDDGSSYDAVSLTRDAAWHIVGNAVGTRKSGIPAPSPVALRAGEMIAPVPEVICPTMHGTTALLRDVHVGDSTSNMLGESTRVVMPQRATIVFGPMDAALAASRSCNLWCLNGPSDEFPFALQTNRSRSFRYERQRTGFPDRVRELKGSGFARDSIALPPPSIGGGPCALSKVPKGVPIDQALRPVAIEFAWSAPTHEPHLDDCDQYIAAVSFVIGRRLIPVGLTLFDEHAAQRLHVLRDAWAVDLRADVRRPSMPPIEVNQAALAALVPNFVQRAAEFGLHDAMWLIWLSESVPMEAALPNLATALETVMTAWFRSTKTKSLAKYLDDKVWSQLSAAAIDGLKTALGGQPNADRILRRVGGANNFGVNERFERFFEEIDLPVGDVENRAISARNRAAHGGGFSAAQYQALANTVRAYRTLLARVVLKLLDWTGEYLDYSSYGFPVRALRTPAGGPEGDSVPAKL